MSLNNPVGHSRARTVLQRHPELGWKTRLIRLHWCIFGYTMPRSVAEACPFFKEDLGGLSQGPPQFSPFLLASCFLFALFSSPFYFYFAVFLQLISSLRTVLCAAFAVREYWMCSFRLQRRHGTALMAYTVGPLLQILHNSVKSHRRRYLWPGVQLEWLMALQQGFEGWNIFRLNLLGYPLLSDHNMEFSPYFINLFPLYHDIFLHFSILSKITILVYVMGKLWCFFCVVSKVYCYFMHYID